MRVTVAICTWNRAALLRETLEGLTRLRVPAGVGWEVLVVDNGCTDGTAEVLDGVRGRLPLRVVGEPEPGLARARNRAVEDARGAYLLWTDDDVVVGRDWLADYLRAFEDDPEAAVFGGPIDPRFLAPPPEWITGAWDSLRELYALRAVPDGGGPIVPGHPPFGANYALRSDVQRRFPYDPALGRIRGGLVGNEEIVVIEAVLASGYRGRWVPTAGVEHLIPPDRLTSGYVRRVLAGHAFLEAHLLPRSGGFEPGGAPVWLWKKWIQAECAYAFHRAVSGPEKWLEHLRRASLRRGQLEGLRAARRAGLSGT